MHCMHRKREAASEETNKPLAQAALGRDNQVVCYPTCLTGAQQQTTPPISTATRREQWIQSKARESLLGAG
jgi:hypothetical protein